MYTFIVISRPGQSQGLLYKHIGHSLIDSVKVCENTFTAPQRPDGCRWCFQSKNRLCYNFFWEILNSEGYPNCIAGLKVTAIFLNWWILPIGGASLGRVSACSLRSRLVYPKVMPNLYTRINPDCI